MAADGVVPDGRDGLTPICRRALEALGPELRGSAQIVDAVLRDARRRDGGRRAIYGELVRMARDWELRHPLVDAQGNLGSRNGDGAASAEYTRMRLASAGADALQARFPNLLVNGSFSLTTGSASSIPPHNLREVAGAALAFIDDPTIDVEGLMRHVTGPDFPTGGIVVGEGLHAIYETGRGKIAVRARAHVEHAERADAIVVSELPFMVSTGGKGGVLAEIARAAKDGKIDGVAAIDDLSDEREGLRIVIGLTPGAPGDG
ncbi:MAG TPA: DNA gyrase subunit A, partial [Solirubrobacteraceae bacterium]|nr:DNA gyrase subunit A [Solirubrobacteraceae bacterium]